MTTQANPLFALSTAALVASATPDAIAELARRGRDAQGLKAGYVAKCLREGIAPAFWKAPKAAPAKVEPTFARAVAELPTPAKEPKAPKTPKAPKDKAVAAVSTPKRDTLAAVRRDMGARLDETDKTVSDLASAVRNTHQSVLALSQLVTKAMAR